MKTRAVVASTLLALSGAVVLLRPSTEAAQRGPVLAGDPPCATVRRIVEIREANPSVDKAHHDLMRSTFVQHAQRPNTTILLGPNVVLDFSDVPDDSVFIKDDSDPSGYWTVGFPIHLGRCVTIRSVASFAPPPGILTATPTGAGVERTDRGSASSGRGAAGVARRRAEAAAAAGRKGEGLVAELPQRPVTVPDARSSTAPGPVLRFGPHRSSGDKTFLEARCFVDLPDQADHIRLSGFRVHGPSFGAQEVEDRGMVIDKCVDIEISNMEIAGFGQGIRVQDGDNEYFNPPLLAQAWQMRGIEGVCREPPYNGPLGRIGSPDQVRIIGNYIRNNQRPRGILDGHAGGYGVEVTNGAYARISQNVFAANRHAIAAGGTMGGYDATQNLVLRYGGVHFDTVFTVHTHAFDIHGTGDNGFDGWAGARTTYSQNAFQYTNGNAIEVRGSPRCGIQISDNVFPHRGLENDWGADAVALRYRQDIGAIKLGPNNRLDTQTYGEYGVCDFDADGVDDLFLATGVSWWFSGMGEFPWRFLAARNERLNEVRFGYFDADNRCDVLTDTAGAWWISSGGTGRPYRLSEAYAPLPEVAFGRFDLSQRDTRPGTTKRTTHAFWRTPAAQWKITTLSGAAQGWRDVGSSRVEMRDLKFGDFNGDGVTDILASVDNHWSISSGVAEPWRRINATLGNAVRGLYVADIDHNNKDDLIRLTHRTLAAGGTVVQAIDWDISYDASGGWQPLKSYRWPSAGIGQQPLFTFAGRFGSAPGAAVLTVDRGGTGHFFAPLETRRGANPDWTSTFPY